MKKCPICGNVLTFHKAEMHGFSWSNPYIDSGCGFMYTEHAENHTLRGANRSGKTDFEVEEYAKSEAEYALRSRFSE